MKKIVITGTIGSGKSYVSNILKTSYNLPVLDVDVVAKEVRNHRAKDVIIQYFGDEIVTNGEIDTKKLRTIVFQNDQKLKELESRIHPLVYEEMLKFFHSHEYYPLVIVEHPLVFELGWEKEFDEVWLVTCDLEVAIERLIHNRGYSREEAIQVLSKQEDNKSKEAKVDRIIYNNYHAHLVNQLKDIMKEESIC